MSLVIVNDLHLAGPIDFGDHYVVGDDGHTYVDGSTHDGPALDVAGGSRSGREPPAPPLHDRRI